MPHRQKKLLPLLLGLLCLVTTPCRLCALTQDTVRVAVVLPLKEKTPRGAKMVEFYQGLLLAADSLRHNGLHLELTALHSGSTMDEMDQLLMQHSLRRMDLVVGPLDAAQQLALTDYCNIHGVRLLMPFSTQTQWLLDNPRLYMATAPRATVQAEALWFVQQQFPDHNIILVECNEQNDEGAAFALALRDAMAEQGVYVRTLNAQGDEMAFYQAFNSLRPNLLVLNASSLKALNAFLPKLKDYRREHPDLTVRLLGFPVWQTYTAQLLQDFYEQDTYVFASFYRNPLANRSAQLDQRFLQWFHRPMQQTFPRYGAMGFDLGYYFMRGISLYGDRLELRHDKMPALPYQNPLYFMRSSESDGFVNNFVELIHYTPAQTIDLITRNR